MRAVTHPIPHKPFLRAAYGLLALLFAFSFFYNLGQRPLWGDEAETADLARNVLRFGVPKVDDGKNLISLYGPRIDARRDGVWTWSPWLKEYVCAASLKLFGDHTWAARAPFTLLACLAGLWLAWMLWKVYRSHELNLLFLALYTTCVPLLLHARQCRYYGLLMFSAALLLQGFLWLGERGRWRGPALIAAGLVVQFYSNYMTFPGSVLALALSALFVRRGRPALVGLFAAFGASFLLALPWLLFARPWTQQGNALGLEHPWPGLFFYGAELHLHVLAAPVLILVVWAFIKLKKNAANAGAEPFALFLFCALFVLCSVATLALINVTYFRYLSPVMPLLLALGAISIVQTLQSRAARIGLAMVMIGTNFLSTLDGVIAVPGPPHALSSPYAAFAKGLLDPYEDRFSAVLSFLREHATRGQTIWAGDPEFPLIFYTDLKVVDARFVERRAASPMPDWVLQESASGVGTSTVTPPAPGYQRLLLQVPDTRRTSVVPEPDMYELAPAPRRTSFVLWQRTSD